MSSRRKFLGAAMSALAAAPALLAQEKVRRRTRWQMLANDDPMVDPPFRPDPSTWDDGTITAAWIGHATVLINFFGLKILTDPVFSDRIGLNVAGLFTLGPRRLVKPALTFEDLPPIDLLLLSHAHMDHLDTPSISRFPRSIPVIMAKNTSDTIEDYGFATVYELDWGQWTALGGLRIEALEVKHFGWRFPWEQDRSRGNPDGRSYNAYLLTYKGHSIVFGGDTAYHDRFSSLRRRNIVVDLAIMPIGCYDPWIANHASPEQALAMADQMGAASLLPIHWRTFVQSDEPVHEPIERLKKAADPGRVLVDAVGQTWSMPRLSTQIPPTDPIPFFTE